MPLPPGATAVTLNVNPPVGVSAANIRIRVTPTFDARWGDTFDKLSALLPRTGYGQPRIKVAATDGAGWVDGDGTPITGWQYIVVIDIAGTDFLSTQLISAPAATPSIDLALVAQPGAAAELPSYLAKAALDGSYAPVLQGGYAPKSLVASPALASVPARPIMRPKHLTVFQAGHGWTVGGTGHNAADTTANDATTVPAFGSQSAKLVTAGGATNAYTQNTALPTADWTDKSLTVWLRVADVARLELAGATAGSITVRASSDSSFTNRFQWNITGVTGYPFANGKWIPVTLNFAEAAVTGTPNRAALIAVRVSATDNNTGPLTVNVGEVGQIADPTEAVISLTFDDSRGAHFSVAKKIMDIYGMQGSLYPILEPLGTTNFLTLDQIKSMVFDSGWELGAHATTYATHAAGLTAMTSAQREAELDALILFNQQNGFPLETFAYPLGNHDVASREAVRLRGLVARGAYHPFADTIPPAVPQLLRTWNIGKAGGGRTQSEMQAWVDKVKAGKSWGIVLAHGIDVSSSSDPNATTVENFEWFINYVASQGIAVRTVADVMRGRVPVAAVSSGVVAPATPAGLAAGTMTETTAPLSWTASAGATGYDTQYRLSPSGSWVAGPSVTGVSTTITGLTGGTGYGFQVRAKNSAGVSAWSTEVTASTAAAPTPPATPAGLAVGTPSDTSVPASWSASSGATGYDTQYQTTPGGSWVAGPSTTSALTATLTGLTAATAYAVQVRAKNSAGTSAWSSSVAFTTAASAVTYFSDSYPADGAVTTTEVGAKAYAKSSGTSVANAVSGALQFYSGTTSQALLTVDAGVADLVIRATLVAVSAGKGESLVFRFVDTSNYLMMRRVSSGDTRWSLRKNIAGTISQIASFSQSITAGDVLEVRLSGTAVQVLLNGTSIYNDAVTELATATKCGFSNIDTGVDARWDNFSGKSA